MSTSTSQQAGQQQNDSGSGGPAFAPFELDITFIEGTPAAETVLMCSTGDTCGSSCPSACTTS
ncbi:FxLD family lanthipeptide [Actinomadura atramentaria]|uniref:FxLD family lanthipeptide n=1 Tax=Actinomadura atramentaria TaxID=1990 RepID=UPI000361947C|nr:FxLD family lanthipeptide [Actinomadura atramentaria]